MWDAAASGVRLLRPCLGGTARPSSGRGIPAVSELLIVYVADGEEREERWPSVASFRAWAMTSGLGLSYTAYAQDDDGEWVVTEKGRLGSGGSQR